MISQKIMIMALAVVLSVGGVVTVNTSAVYADSVENYNICENIDEMCEFNEEELEQEWLNEIKDLVSEGIITQKDGDRVIDIENEIDDILDDVENEDELSPKLQNQLTQLFTEHDMLYDKINLAILEKDLKELKVLNDKEIQQFITAEQKINAIYREIPYGNISEDELEAYDNRVEKIIMDNKVLYDKVDEYYDEIDLEGVLDENYYEELVAHGEMTEDEVEHLKEVDQMVYELMESLPEDASDEEYEQLQKEINQLYDALDF